MTVEPYTDLLALIHQYRNDMLYSPAPDSRERRIAAIDATLSRFEPRPSDVASDAPLPVSDADRDAARTLGWKVANAVSAAGFPSHYASTDSGTFEQAFAAHTAAAEAPFRELLTRFFDILNIREESDSGRVFSPVTISSCRVMLTKELGEILHRLEAAVGYKKGTPA